MSYREILQKQIRELKEKILTDESEKFALQKELNKLRISEFDEEMSESAHKGLLKG